MIYECQLENGQHLEIENEGNQTFVSFSSRGAGQNQSQGRGFKTGKWSRNPAVRRVGKDYFIQLQTTDGSRYLRVRGNQTTLLDAEPEWTGAEEIELMESSAVNRMKPMEPMKPMRPMEPMKPLRPLR
jgi:hypothetical protein